jgi:hypothetical protein
LLIYLVSPQVVQQAHNNRGLACPTDLKAPTARKRQFPELSNQCRGPPGNPAAAPADTGSGGKENARSDNHPSYRRPQPASTPTAIEAFRERCEARAILIEACLLDFHEAIDGMQAAAVKSGLVGELGQDAVQAMMAEAFTKVPRSTALSDKTDEPATTPLPPQPRCARSTFDAAEYLLRQNDPARMRRWLAKHTRAERIAILEQIRGKR